MKKGGKVRCGRLLFGLVAVAVVLGGCTPGDDAEEQTTTTQAITTTTTTTEPPLDLQAHAEGLLVGIRSEGDFLNFDTPGTIGEGSGLVVAADGLILTAASSVVGADRINVYLPGEEFPIVGELDAAAECVNLALVRVDHTFAATASMETVALPFGAASATGAAVSVEVISASSTGDRYLFRSNGGAVAGASVFDKDGAVAGIVTGFDSAGNSIALRNDVVASWVRQMRQRDVVQQLGFTTAENTEGQLVVVSLADTGPGAGLALDLGDIVISADGEELVGGLDQLCGALEDGAAQVEVRKAGRRYVGAIPGTPLSLASARSVEQIRRAVVEINVPGGGTGSGFFVSPDGLVVTNFHVAGGATDVSLQFDAADDFISGEVIAASACSDLALIQAEPGTYEYLEWAPESPSLEEEIRIVGFPNATENISFEDGIVAKESAPSMWWVGSISTFETSADVDRGNSGGPVVNKDGEVIGVTYAVQEGSNLGYEDTTLVYNSLHLVGAEARDVVSGMAATTLLDLGFGPNWLYERNLDGVTGLTVEVGEVRSASAADALGLEFGDEIVVFGEVLPQPDSSGFRRLCEVVAANEARNPIDVVVWRYQDDTLWDGQFYGAPLSQRPDPYRLGTEDGTISAMVQGRWTEHDDIDEPSKDWVGYWAAPDLDRYFNEFNGVHGMRLMWSIEKAQTHSTQEHLEGLSYATEASGPILPYSDERFLGHYQTYSFPGGVGVEYALTVAGDPDSPMIMLFVADASHRIDATAARIIETLRLELPASDG